MQLAQFARLRSIPTTLASIFGWVMPARQKGIYQPAPGEFLKVVQPAGGGDQCGDQFYEAVVRSACANSGNTAGARWVLENLIRRSRTRWLPAYGIATFYAVLGEKEHVFQGLEKGYEDRSTWLACPTVDPVPKDSRSEPRFAALEQRVRAPCRSILSGTTPPAHVLYSSKAHP
jgi:hypothetical protein